MTAPSRISAVLSSTTPSRSAGTTLPRLASTSGSPAASACAIERMLRPRDRSARSDNSGTNVPSTKTMRRASMSPISLPAALARALAVASGTPGERLGLSDQGAEIGVFPLLDPPVRQAERVETRGGGLAQRHHLAVAGQLPLRGLVGIGQRLLGVGLHAAEFGVHDASAASPWNCA